MLRVLLVMALAATACSRAAPHRAPDVVEQPIPDAKKLRLTAVTGTAADDVWAVGEHRTFHHDGRDWREVPDAGGLEAIAAATRADVWGVGRAGFVRHFDGTSWSKSHIADAAAAYRDLLDVVAWPGEAWITTLEPGAYFECRPPDACTKKTPPELAGWTLHAPSGESRGDVWATVIGDKAGGSVRKVARFDGGKWRILDGTPWAGLRASGKSVWTATLHDMSRYDGTTFQPAPAPSDIAVTRLSASSPDLAYAVGIKGGLFRWDGARWSRVASGVDGDLDDVWASPDGAAFVVGAPGKVIKIAAPPRK
jgi:hypothetical protein